MRTQGDFNFSNNFEVKKESNLDARTLVTTYADLLLFTASDYIFNELLVSVQNDPDTSKNGQYRLIDKENPQLPESWVRNSNTESDLQNILDNGSVASVSTDLDIIANNINLTTTGTVTYNGSEIATIDDLGVESVSGFGVVNTDPKNPTIELIEDLPSDLEIYCVTNPSGDGLGRRVMYRSPADPNDYFLYLNEFIGPSIITGGNAYSVKVDGNNIFIGYYNANPNENSTEPIFGVLALYDCQFVNNKQIRVGRADRRVYTEIITANVGGAPRLHSEELEDGFLYYTTRVYTTTTDTQIIKINAYNLTDYKIIVPFKGGAVHNTQVYKNYLYLMQASSQSTPSYMYRVKLDFSSVEQVFTLGEDNLRRIKRSAPFTIYDDKIYVTTIRNENTLIATNTIGLSTYRVDGKLINHAADLVIGTNTIIAGSPTVHWMSIFNGTLLLHSAAGSTANSVKSIVSINLNTNTVNYIPSPYTNFTDDNIILPNGYVILNPEGSTTTNQQVKLKYNNFNDIQYIGYIGFRCAGGRDMYVAPMDVLKTKTSELANTGEDGTSPYATKNFVQSITGATWGQISGPISAQTDLNNILLGKFNNPTGSTAQYLNGAGQPSDFIPIDVSGLVPYSGATQNIDFNNKNLFFKSTSGPSTLQTVSGYFGINVNERVSLPEVDVEQYRSAALQNNGLYITRTETISGDTQGNYMSLYMQQDGDAVISIGEDNDFRYNSEPALTDDLAIPYKKWVLDTIGSVSGGSQDLQSVLEYGSEASITTPININTSDSVTINAINGFMLQGNAGGQISTNQINGINISGNAGGVRINGNNLGVDIMGDSGGVNIQGGSKYILLNGPTGIFMSGGSQGITMNGQGGNVNVTVSSGNTFFYNGIKVATINDITIPTAQQVFNQGSSVSLNNASIYLSNSFTPTNVNIVSMQSNNLAFVKSNGLSTLNGLQVRESGNVSLYTSTAMDINSAGIINIFSDNNNVNVNVSSGKTFNYNGIRVATINDIPTGSTGTAWGQISGTLSAQTDLNTVLNSKFSNPTGTTNSLILGDGSISTRANVVFFTTGPNIIPNNVVLSGGSQTNINNSFQGQLNVKIGSATGSPITVKDIWAGDSNQYATATTASTTMFFVQDDSQEVKGSISLSANGTTAINIPHSLGVVPTYVNVMAKSPSASGATYVSATTTNIIVNYNTAPTGNLQYWIRYNR